VLAPPSEPVVAEPRERVAKVWTELVEARSQSAAEAAARWVPSRHCDGGGLVYQACAFPRTCQVGGTLPTLGCLEKPCDADCSKPAA
jgi:hypothetical protein